MQINIQTCVREVITNALEAKFINSCFDVYHFPSTSEMVDVQMGNRMYNKYRQ